MDGDFKWALRLAAQSVRIGLWIVTTTWLGMLLVTRVIAFIRLWPTLRAEALACPRDHHETPAFGVWECSSSGGTHLYEGWAFGRCGLCGMSAGWTPCVTCGLPIRNPLAELWP